MVIAAALAFLLGYAVNQASTCAVTAAKLLLHDSETGLTIGFLLAVAVAGVVTLPLAWWLGPQAHLAPWTMITPGLLGGAVLLGIGAVINDACLFGTLHRIGDGQLRFLALPVGLGLGFVLVEFLPALVAAPSRSNPLALPGPNGWLALALFALAALVAGRLLAVREKFRLRSASWPFPMTMVLFGLAGALLYALVPGWTYADAVRRAVGAVPSAMAGIAAAVCALASLAGTLSAGLRSGSFHCRAPTPIGIVRSLLGGTIMALGSVLIPGGNDTLLFAALPALSPGGIAAYLMMTATVLVLLYAIRRLTAPDYLQ